MKGSIRTVVISDLHVGSNYALGALGQVDSFYEFVSDLWSYPDNLIINGDIIDGLAYRGNLEDCWTNDLKVQSDTAIKFIARFRARRIYVIRGTPYHTQTKGVDLEEYIGEKIHAVSERGRYSTEVKLINLAPKGAPSKIVHVAHHISGSKWFMYRGTAQSREMANVMLNESHFIDRSRHDKIFGIIRGHNHYYWFNESTSRIAIQCPCWQLQTPFMLKIAPSSVPDIGAIRIECFNDGSYGIQKQILKSREMLPKVW